MDVENCKKLLSDGRYSIDDKEVLMADVVSYCRQDTVALYNIVKKFFSDIYTKPLGHSFISKKFYHSASAIAWDVVTTCFMKVPMFINPYTQKIEERMKIGGLT